MIGKNAHFQPLLELSTLWKKNGVGVKLAQMRYAPMRTGYGKTYQVLGYVSPLLQMQLSEITNLKTKTPKHDHMVKPLKHDPIILPYNKPLKQRANQTNLKRKKIL
jgi:hypothetical protein